MSDRNEFIERIKNINTKSKKEIKGISNKYKGKFKDNKKILSLVLAAAMALGTAGCANIKDNVQNENRDTIINHSKKYEKHGNKNYLERDEFFDEYCYIKSMLKNKEQLNKQDIIDISNSFKKIDSSLYYIDSLDETGNTEVITELPEMPGLHTDIKENIIDLIVDKSVLTMPKGLVDFQKELIAESYLTYTDCDFLENIKISEVDANRYCVVSNEGKFFFEIYISTDDDGTILIEPNTDLEDMKKIASNGVSIVGTEKVKDTEYDIER